MTLHRRKSSGYPTNPFVAVWPGQDPVEAIDEHARLTGHAGPFLIRFMSDPSAGLLAA